MSKWTLYDLWALEPDKNWVCYGSISFMSTTKENAIEYASKHVDKNRPTQLMHVLPSGRTRVALWVDGEQVPLNTIPY